MSGESGTFSYKEQHEKFVSDQPGTTVGDIVLVSAACSVSIFMRDALLSWLYRGKSSATRSRFLLDFICLVLPGLFSATLFSSSLDNVLISMMFVGMLLVFITQKANQYVGESETSANHPSHIIDLPMSQHRPFITHFRAFVNIATAIMILAVDFKVFPRRFCKTETYGTGLMDIGVGGFIVSNAIVSPEARGKFRMRRGILGKVKQLLHAFKSTLPLWTLGLIRLLAVKSTDYHEHISEYGVHWNFFFTLAAVRVLSTLVLLVFPVAYCWILSLLIIIGYQYLLVSRGLKEFILFGVDGAGGRDGFFNANREGICSTLGYLALYLASVTIGRYLAQPRTNFKDWLKALIVLLMVDSMLWNILGHMDDETEPVSRRMANLGYVIWMLAHQLFVLCSLFLVDLLSVTLQHVGLVLPKDSSKTEFCLLESVNQNGLAFFMFANLLTGLVNFSMETIFASSGIAYSVLISYMFVLSLITAFLHVNKITLKFW